MLSIFLERSGNLGGIVFDLTKLESVWAQLIFLAFLGNRYSQSLLYRTD